MKWKQTGKGEAIHRYDLPLLDSLRILDMSDSEITFILGGDFDGFVYVFTGTCDWNGDQTLELMRYPAELVPDEQPVAADYADSAE